jgi:hypothetical protein
MKTICINIFAGPSAGKSVLASDVFSALSKRGEKVELVREWVKGWAWQGIDSQGWANSVYIFSKQLRSEAILYGKVNVIVTDSPLGLPPVYEAMYNSPSTAIFDLYKATRKRQREEGIVYNLDLCLMRQHPYQTEGRYETEDQARRVDQLIRQMLPCEPVKNAEDVLEALAQFRKTL